MRRRSSRIAAKKKSVSSSSSSRVPPAGSAKKTKKTRTRIVAATTTHDNDSPAAQRRRDKTRAQLQKAAVAPPPCEISYDAYENTFVRVLGAPRRLSRSRPTPCVEVQRELSAMLRDIHQKTEEAEEDAFHVDDKWTIVKVLGAGGSGVVVEMTDPLKRSPNCVLKIHTDKNAECEMQHEFWQDGLAVRPLSCDQIPTSMWEQRVYVMAMEKVPMILRVWVEGYEDRHGGRPLSASVAKRLVANLVRLLTTLVQRNVTHGDMTWDNIGVMSEDATRAGSLVLLDFGYSTLKFNAWDVDYLQLLNHASHRYRGSDDDKPWVVIRSALVDAFFSEFETPQHMKTRAWTKGRKNSPVEPALAKMLHDEEEVECMWKWRFDRYQDERRKAGDTANVEKKGRIHESNTTCPPRQQYGGDDTRDEDGEDEDDASGVGVGSDEAGQADRGEREEAEEDEEATTFEPELVS